jgi:hypothetical protein
MSDLKVRPPESERRGASGWSVGSQKGVAEAEMGTEDAFL